MDALNYLIEIAVTDYPTAKAAVAGGADRIELCCALSEGGITPSYGLVRQCREDFDIPIFPIIRPHAGDFLYSEEEFRIIKQDVLLYKQLGCEGVVVGFLQKDGTIDRKKTGIIRDLAYPMELTFHRAFDRAHDPLAAMEELIGLGCQRILTSGQQLTAPEGIVLLRQLVEVAAGRIIILPGSGVKPENIKELAGQTGATEFHASLRATIPSEMSFVHPAFSGTDDYTRTAVQEAAVRKLKEALS